MENASKALLMAGGVLIGILVLSLAVYLYASFSQTYMEVNERNETQKVIKFNNQFAKYINRDNLTIYDIITVVGYGKENNVTVKLGTQNLTTADKTVIDNLVKNDLNKIKEEINSNGIKEKNEELPKYKCNESGIKYNGEKGRVSEISFTN